jgi:hypothetical protein
MQETPDPQTPPEVPHQDPQEVPPQDPQQEGLPPDDPGQALDEITSPAGRRSRIMAARASGASGRAIR